jgi:putative AdoMet-dependent methyltransferase
MPDDDPFSPSEFDPWAETYDHDVSAQSQFPFDGYDRVLETLVRLAAPTPGITVLEVGTGTGNLAARFAGSGCELWCTDFSEAMLEKAREKVSGAHFVLHDLRVPLPAELDRRFDRIVSAYVFHHFDMSKKAEIARELATGHLAPDGKLIIADLSFANQQKMDRYATSIGDLWEAEPYWLADQAKETLTRAGLRVAYMPVSACAGVYTITV